jgi:hypothetical protein
MFAKTEREKSLNLKSPAKQIYVNEKGTVRLFAELRSEINSARAQHQKE